jgi:mannose-6-phosphate isomerase-like protein (cupin superfamily)
MYELFLVEHGRGMMLVDGFEIEISRGDSMVINPGEYHALMNPFQGELRVVVMGILSSPS